MKTVIALFLLGLAFNAMATTYYVDFASGNDANNGTTTSTPWKRAPGMGGFSGSYSSSGSDRFIFKGGVTWNKTCFPLWAINGSSPGMTYYGVDKSWYAGVAWNRPVFDAQSSAVGSGALNRMVSYNSGGGKGNIQIDNIEFRNYYWDASSQDYGSAIINIWEATNFLVSNCLFHQWTHGSYGSGTRDNGCCILGATTGYTPANCASNCVFDGSAGDGRSMMAVYCIWKVTHCVATNLTNGFLCSGSPGEVSYCWIGPINGSFDPNDHENSIETEGTGSSLYIHHNIISGAIGACILAGDVGNTFYVYDNLIFNSVPVPIGFDSSIYTGKTATGYVWNNTVIGSSSQTISSCRGHWTLIVQNNHFIAGGIGNCGKGTQSVTQDHNYQNSTLGDANALGYTISNMLQPVSAGSPTVGVGVDLSSTGIPDITKDLNGVTRSGAWDIGAYQFSTNSLPYYSLTVVNGSGDGTYASNSMAPITADTIGGQTFTNWSANVQGLIADTNSSSTTVTVNTNVTVTANYYTNPPVLLPGIGVWIAASNATTSAPFVLTNSYFLQVTQTTDPTVGGQAIFKFAVTNAGSYIIQTLVNASGDAYNSFFVNVDAQLSAPTNIWDIPITSGFEQRIVSWRGNGTDTANQFVPAVFNLSAGVHQIIIRGREMNTQLQSVAILYYLDPPHIVYTVATAP